MPTPKFRLFAGPNASGKTEEFRSHILRSGLFKEKINVENFPDQFRVRSGVLTVRKDVLINSYHASFVATYLAEKLFESRQSFTFETVMSHPSKLDFLRIARKEGYKTYLYYNFTDDLNTNLARVQLRISDGGHSVSPEHTLVNRSLPHSIMKTDRRTRQSKYSCGRRNILAEPTSGCGF